MNEKYATLYPKHLNSFDYKENLKYGLIQFNEDSVPMALQSNSEVTDNHLEDD